MKPKIGKKGGLTKPKPGLSALGADDDDSMVAPGGPALDDDTVEHVERPRGKKKKGIPNTVSPRIPDRYDSDVTSWFVFRFVSSPSSSSSRGHQPKNSYVAAAPSGPSSIFPPALRPSLLMKLYPWRANLLAANNSSHGPN
jgi:hypothetical protein